MNSESLWFVKIFSSLDWFEISAHPGQASCFLAHKIDPTLSSSNRSCLQSFGPVNINFLTSIIFFGPLCWYSSCFFGSSGGTCLIGFLLSVSILHTTIIPVGSDGISLCGTLNSLLPRSTIKPFCCIKSSHRIQHHHKCLPFEIFHQWLPWAADDSPVKIRSTGVSCRLMTSLLYDITKSLLRIDRVALASM